MKKMQLRQILARNLEAAMERTPGLETQQALAKRAKMGQSHISRIMTMTTAPTVDTLAAISEALGVQPWELLIDADTTREAVISRYMAGPINPVSDARVEEAFPPTPKKVTALKRRKG